MGKVRKFCLFSNWSTCSRCWHLLLMSKNIMHNHQELIDPIQSVAGHRIHTGKLCHSFVVWQTVTQTRKGWNYVYSSTWELSAETHPLHNLNLALLFNLLWIQHSTTSKWWITLWLGVLKGGELWLTILAFLILREKQGEIECETIKNYLKYFK